MLLTDSNNMKFCYGKITPEMLEDHLCRDTYSLYLKAYTIGSQINVMDVTKNLESDMVTKKEINTFIKSCLDELVLSDNEKKSLVKNIQDTNKAKELYSLCSQASYKPKDIKQTLITINKRTEEMLKDEKPKGQSISEIAEKYKDYYGHEHKMGLRVGLYELDEILNGLNPGDVYVIGARPAVGKSALATQMIMNVADKSNRVGYFNLEMTNQQILERMIARESGISLIRLRKAVAFIGDEEERYVKAINKFVGKNNLFVFSGSYTPSEMKAICKNLDLDLIVIDYLQLVKADRQYGNRVAEVGDISKSIKSMAMELKTPVIALSQLNRASKPTEEPSMADLRESGDIEQDASVIMLMWNMDEDGKTKGLKVDKNRQGELGKVALAFEGENMNFRPINYQTFEQTEKRCNTKGDCPF